ncbi:MAG: hypothetical protein PHE17_20225 [Thiothrix sp.]|uniref:hypothetical protein n=1 Tax=Thiothrix sp. TaxID=1032 RepID=UPI002616213C|nr:hypothetical protein [Thiothrix sp.]MDD5395357.1 hypothetical protein [Thiothrix sp.]
MDSFFIKVGFTCWLLLPLVLLVWWGDIFVVLGYPHIGWKDILIYFGGAGLAAFTLGIIIAVWIGEVPQDK